MTIKEKSTLKVLKFVVPIIIEPDEAKYYGHSPALPGLIVGGDTRVEALQNARDGAIALLHSMIRDGEPIPLCLTTINASDISPVVRGDKVYTQEEIKVAIS
jgi:predicted RNase H-like HicB family nuclease